MPLHRKHGMVINGVTGALDTSKTCNRARWPTSIRHDHTVFLHLPAKRIKTLLHSTFYTKNAKQTSSSSFVLSMLHHKNECILYKIECDSIASTCFWVPVQMTASICTRLPLRSYSPERRQLQPLQHWPWAVSAFWCRAKRRCHASFGRTRGVAPRPLHGVLEPDHDYLLLLTISVFNAEYIIYNVRLESLSCLKKIQDKTDLHLQCCQVCWNMLASQVERTKHVLPMDRSTACLLATLSDGSLRNITTARRKNQMHWMHWTRTYRMYMDVHGCTIHSSNASLGGKGPSELMRSIDPAPQWLEVTNNVYTYIHILYIIYHIYNSWCCMMISGFDPIWSFEISWIPWRFVIST